MCHSEAKESTILLRREQKFEQELLAIKEGLKKKRKFKKYGKIMERIGSFKERYKVFVFIHLLTSFYPYSLDNGIVGQDFNWQLSQQFCGKQVMY